MFKEALDKIKQYNTIIIHRHQKPDGDALGSQIGLMHIIRENFPEKKVYIVGDEAKRYSFMDGSVMDKIDDSLYTDALAIILDTSSASLISDERYRTAAASLRFDHHIFIEKIAETEVVDTSYESCCGILTEFALKCGLKLNALAAKSLFTGIITDSGRFRYDSTDSDTYRRVSELTKYDFSPSEIYENLYSDDFSNIRLRASFVMRINITDKNIAYIYTDKAELESLGIDSFTASRGMVGTMSDIKGVDIWVNFTETDAGVLCEIRSGKYNINPIAVKYGGGGHAKASGATLPDKSTAMLLLSDLKSLVK